MPPFRRMTGRMTRQRIRATLRVALNSPMGRRVVANNSAQHLEMPQAKRRKAKLWTDVHVRRWQEAGERPSPVMVDGKFFTAPDGNWLHLDVVTTVRVASVVTVASP
ncbi:hypothetical protein ABUW04_12385 [Streptacidiphilus sp. N1-10]|uniref:Uncharacterized protein n=1 Tax=Streptacidiphilus jeojiensis TaxID=3229225 RepID=A0ABV6XLF1_9ACTN